MFIKQFNFSFGIIYVFQDLKITTSVSKHITNVYSGFIFVTHILSKKNLFYSIHTYVLTYNYLRVVLKFMIKFIGFFSQIYLLLIPYDLNNFSTKIDNVQKLLFTILIEKNK